MSHRVRLIGLVVGLTWLAAAASLSADDVLAVRVLDADGQVTVGPLKELSSQSVHVGSEVMQSWTWRDVVSLRFESKSARIEPREAAIWLANGDRLIARGRVIENERLLASWLRLNDSASFSLPLESVRGFSLEWPHSRSGRDEIAAWIHDRPAARDELRLFNGDVIVGELDSWQDDVFRLKTAGASVAVPRREVLTVALNPELLSVPESKDPCWLMSFRDGSRLTAVASKSGWSEQHVNVTHITGEVWNFDVPDVADVRVLNGRAIWLSDLKPIEFSHSPFLPGARTWPLRKDRSVAGGPLRCEGREFPKGLGMHSRSTATFELQGRFRWFRTWVGLDDTTSGNGTAACAIEADGRRVWEVARLDRKISLRNTPLLDMTGVQRLTLIVDFAELGDVQDHVNWCDAVLMPRESP